MPDSKRWVCLGCGYMYDQDKGMAPQYPEGTPFSTLAEDDFSCPTCGFTADLFEPFEKSVWRSRPVEGSYHPGNDDSLSEALQEEQKEKSGRSEKTE